MPGEDAHQTDFFRTAYKLIDVVIDTATKGKFAEYSAITVDFLQYAVTFYIIIYAFQTMAGRQKTPMSDFLWHMGKMGVILMFVKDIDGWMTNANQAINDMKETFSGGLDPWMWLDQLWLAASQVSAKIYQLDTETVPLAGFIGASVTYIGTITALLSASIVFFTSEITLKLLTITAPIFVMCLMFGFLRQMFNNWLRLILGSLLTLMFATLVLRAGASYLNHVLSVLMKEAEQSNLMTIGFMALAAGIFTASIIWLAKHYASQIASVGVEGAIQGAVAIGLSAATFGTSNLSSKGPDLSNEASGSKYIGPAKDNKGIGRAVAEAVRERYGR